MATREIVGDVYVDLSPSATVTRAGVWVVEHILKVLEQKERCSIALSGGSTPGPMYAEVARAGRWGEYDGSRLDLYLADERCVPALHSDSNQALVRETWLSQDDRPRLFSPEFHPGKEQAEAQDYADQLPSCLDLVVLGIGEDGHTASLFPNSQAVREQERPFVWVEQAPKPPPARWTITPPALASAHALVTLACGADKSKAVSLALQGSWSPVATPAQLARRGTWFLDGKAAHDLDSIPMIP